MYVAILLSAAAFLISFFSLFYFRAYLARRTGQERILSEMREEVNNILKTIDETTDRDISLIEERERILKDLLLDIEKRLKTYVREMERQKAAEEVSIKTYQDMGKKRYSINAHKDSGVYAADEQLSPEPASSGPDSNAGFPLPRFNVKPDPASSPMGTQIRELLRAGLSAPIIASRLGISISEVEFAEALIERRDN